MGLFKKKEQSDKKLTPDMAGYRPAQEWWPDLTAYRKAILLHNISYDEIDSLLKEYATLWAAPRPVVCDFFYTALPDDSTWIYLEFPNFEKVPHYENFSQYLNLMIWLSEKADRQFCLAIPQNPNQPLFLSTMDEQNPCGDACMGIYADRDFYFEVAGDMFEWGPVPTAAFNYVGFLKNVFQFDTQWIPEVTHCKWVKTQITLTFPE